MYIIKFDWWDDEVELPLRGDEFYFFDDADSALCFGHAAAYEEEVWQDCGCPRNGYLFRTDSHYFTEEECRFLCCWPSMDRNVKE